MGGCGVVMSASIHAADLFKSCETISTETSFEALSNYFASHPGNHLYCLALTRDAFVFTTKGNFEDCRIEKVSNRLECQTPSTSRRYPDLDLLANFSGGGKSFALFRSEQLTGGNFDESYAVFYRVSRYVDPRGYRIVSLDGAGAHDQSDATGQCASAADLPIGQPVSDAVKAGTTPFEIVDDGRSDVTIRFNQQTLRCGTGAVVDSTVAYRWSGDHFAKTVPR